MVTRKMLAPAHASCCRPSHDSDASETGMVCPSNDTSQKRWVGVFSKFDRFGDLATVIVPRLVKYFIARISGRVHSLPVLVLMPHSRCNCQCVMCDIWKNNQNKREITSRDLAPHLEAFRRLGVKRVVLSGGEPLMHSNMW